MGLSQILESAFCYLQQSLFYYYFNMYIRSDRLLKGGENVKFIHTGDIHWGMSPDSDKPWSRERSRDIRDTFTAIIAKAKELRVDCLFIAGDLFHRQPLLRDLKEVNYLFSTIPQTQITAITRDLENRFDDMTGEKTYIDVAHTDNDEMAQELAAELRELFPETEVRVEPAK